MRFHIGRTSITNKRQAPCEEAVPGVFTEEEIDSDERIQTWYIEIETLEELMALYEKYGRFVIDRKHFTKELHIEIYDDYRE